MRARAAGDVAPLVIPLAVALIFVAAPWDVDSKLRLALSGLCAQRPGHSFFVDGAPLPLEARMLGIFVGFAASVLACWLAGGLRRTGLPRGLWAAAVLFMIAALVVDGLNALFYDQETTPLFASAGDVARTALVLGGFALLVLSGAPGRLALSLVALVGAVFSFWLVNTYIAVVLWQGAGVGEDWRDVAWSVAVGFLLTAGELWALAALRGWAETSFGFVYSF